LADKDRYKGYPQQWAPTSEMGDLLTSAPDAVDGFSTNKEVPWMGVWRVIIMRSRGEHIGTVEAPDRERAEVEAVKLFDLDQDQRRRLLIRERL
jgi:hypothetical protein